MAVRIRFSMSHAVLYPNHKGKLCSGDATLILGYEIDCLKPGSQRNMATMHECTGSHRSLMMAVNALIQPIFQQIVMLTSAFWANEAVLPAVPCQSISANRLGSVLLRKLFVRNSFHLVLRHERFIPFLCYSCLFYTSYSPIFRTLIAELSG